jgi:hypothetical protein
LGAQKGIGTPPVPEQTEGGLKNELANLRRGKRITKKPQVRRGHETNWEMSVEIRKSKILTEISQTRKKL